MDLPEIKMRLVADVDAVVRHLLPSARCVGKEWQIGSLKGEAGQSLKIRASGLKAGVWSDFSTSQSGDLIDLWIQCRGVTLSDAVTEMKDFLGYREPMFHEKPKKQFKRPEKPVCVVPRTKVLEYLTVERKLTQDTITAFKIAEDGDEIVFPFLKNGELYLWKRLHVQRDDKGKKRISISKDAEPCLFGWQALDPNARHVCLTEGEIDAMSLHQMGFPALSIPMGANNNAWIEVDYESLDRFETIYICFDQDDAGQKAAIDVAHRLGLHRVRIIDLPCKDANEALQRAYDKETIDLCLQYSESLDPQELKRGDAYLPELESFFYNSDSQQNNHVTPWQKTHGKLHFRPGELSIWTGINGHGKSQALGHAMVDLMAQGAKVCIASMEIKPVRLLYRLSRQVSCMRQPSLEYLRVVNGWFGDKLWLFDVVGTAKTERILDVFAFARKKYGIQHFVIDSLMKCGIAEDDYKAQKAFIETLCDFKNAMDCHVHLVAHSRKGESEKAQIGKMDVKGTGAITDLADNVFSVWRNKSKEEESNKEHPDEKKMLEPDAVVICDKQRNGEWEGKIALWFDGESFQYLESDSLKPKRYVPYSRLNESGAA
jgi:twinkle protein